ncbi:helix-turn-helix domain-containing protein [Amycolatopsis albispora]|uniref:helix-turn-helix domain-containing protein n=1 Tax=Amycolatopsis albispora TaxID=1804986 RepID=UPI0013B3D960|nr:helix-turn-helix domain-containing protein [Amycolatopsis albispora]
MTEAAEIVGCSRQNINNLINSGKLPAGNAGTTLVLAEDTVRRYAAGERFSFPTVLVIDGLDEATDGWVEQFRKAVPPDYEMPERFAPSDLGVAAGEPYRVELLDNQGRTLAVKTVDAEAVN